MRPAQEKWVKCRRCGETKPESSFIMDGSYYSPCRECLLEVNRVSRSRVRLRANRYKTPCVVCGERWTPVIHFHHIDPHAKRFSLSDRAALHKATDDDIEHEAAKCLCLCASCHQKLHTDHPQVVAVIDALLSARRPS